AVDVRAEDREHALDAFAIGDLADGEALHDARAGAGDDHALIGLQAFLVAFADLHPHLDGVAMGELGVGAALSQSVVLLLVELFDDVHWGIRSDLFNGAFPSGDVPDRPVLVARSFSRMFLAGRRTSERAYRTSSPRSLGFR